MKKESTVRWKTLAVGLALIGAFWLFARHSEYLDDSMYRTGFLMLCGFLVALWIPIWILTASGLRWKPRLLWFFGTVILLAIPTLLVRVDGFEGAGMLQLSWRWDPPIGAEYDELEGDRATWQEDLPGQAEVPEFMGAGGHNHVAPDLLPADWEMIVPRERWRRQIGLGWTSFAVARGLAITQEQRDDEEVIVAYALDDGAAIWEHRNSVRFSEVMGGDGPRATPTIAGDRVVVMGATGVLDCLDLTTGALHWSRDVLAEHGHANLEWGQSGSPLVVRDLVIVTLGKGEGGSLAAYDLATGEPRWRGGERVVQGEETCEASYATPVLRTIDGVEQVVVLYADHLAGHVVETGEELWAVEVPRAAANVANPIVFDETKVLVTIGYGKGARCFDVKRDEAGAWTVEFTWRSMAMKTKFTNPTRHGEHIYGLDEGRLVCMDLETGRRVWKGTRFGHGQVLGVGDHLVVQAEDGDVAIVEASPEGETVVQRFPALSSKTWNQPVMAGRFLLVRNDREVVCFEYLGR